MSKNEPQTRIHTYRQNKKKKEKKEKLVKISKSCEKKQIFIFDIMAYLTVSKQT